MKPKTVLVINIETTSLIRTWNEKKEMKGKGKKSLRKMLI